MSKKTSIHKTMQSKKRKELARKQEIDHRKGLSLDENPTDYGGFPERDLKKNLGCG